MAEQMKPASPQQAPDPSFNYERAHPEREAGMGRLDNNVSTPTQAPDRQEAAVTNKQEPRQINAHEVDNGRQGRDASAAAARPQPAHSMKDEEPMGWDQAPQDIDDNRQKRHPRTDGRGGTP